MNKVAHRIISLVLTAALAVSVAPTQAFADVQLRLPRLGGKEAEGKLPSNIALSTTAKYDAFVMDVLENKKYDSGMVGMSQQAAYRYNLFKDGFRKLSRPSSGGSEKPVVTVEKNKGNTDFDDLIWTAEKLGLQKGDTLFEADTDQLTTKAQEKLNGKIQNEVELMKGALLKELPNDFYWVDASKGIQISYKMEKLEMKAEPQIALTEITFTFTPAADYSAGGQVDTSKGNRVMKAADKAKEVIQKSPTGIGPEKTTISQYHKFLGSQAGGTSNNELPEALLCAFDGNAGTKLSSVETAKVFQWMFDRTKFAGNGTSCYTVQGKRDGTDHTWNVVTLSDGQNYVVDIDDGQGPLLALATNPKGGDNPSYEIKHKRGNAVQKYQYTYNKKDGQSNNNNAPLVSPAPPALIKIEIQDVDGKNFTTSVPTTVPFEQATNQLRFKAIGTYDGVLPEGGTTRDVTDLCVWSMVGKPTAGSETIKNGISFNVKSQELLVTNDASTNNNNQIQVTIKAAPTEELMNQADVDKDVQALTQEQIITITRDTPAVTHIGFPQRQETGGGAQANSKDIYKHDVVTSPPHGQNKTIVYPGQLFDQYGHLWDTTGGGWKWTWGTPDPVSNQLTLTPHQFIESQATATIVGGADPADYNIKVSATDGTKTIDQVLTISIKQRVAIEVKLEPTEYTTPYDPRATIDVFKAIVPTASQEDIDKYAHIEFNINGKWGTAQPVKVGTYSVRAVFSSPEFYGTSDLGTLNIEKVELGDESMVEIIVEEGSRYNGGKQMPKVTVIHAVNGKLEENKDYTVRWVNNIEAYEHGNSLYNGRPAPYVEITGTGDNYTGTLKKEFDIERMPVQAVRFDTEPIEKEYDGTTEIAEKLTLTFTGAKGKNFTFKIGAKYASKDASSNIKIILDEIDDALIKQYPGLENYLITPPANLKGAILPRPILITPTSRSGGNPSANKKKYGQVDPVLEYDVGGKGLVEGEKLEGQLDREPGEDVLDKLTGAVKYREIKQGTLTSDRNPNYAITYDPGSGNDYKFLIEPASMNVDVKFDPSTTKINRRVLVIVTAQNREENLMESGWNEPERPTVKVLKDATGKLGSELALTGGGRGEYHGEFHTPPIVPEDPIMRFEVVMDDQTGNYVNPADNKIAETEIVEKGKVSLTLDHNKPDGSFYGDTIIFTVKALKEDPLDPDDVNGNVEFYLGNPGCPFDPKNPSQDNPDFPNKTYIDATGREQKVIKLGGGYLSKGECTFKLLEPRDLIVENGMGGWHDIYAVYRGNSAFWPAEAVQKPVQILKKQLEWDTSDLTASKRQNQKGDTDVYGQLRLLGVLEDEVTVRPGPLRTNGFDDEEPGVYEDVQVVPKEGGIWELVSNPAGVETNYLRPVSNPTISATVEPVTEPEQDELPKPDRPGQKFKLTVEHGLSKVPDTLLNNVDLDTTRKIREAMLDFNAELMEHTSVDRSVIYDVNLMVSYDSGVHWEKATAEEFPAEGLPITLPYPEGTGKKNDFVVSHMFTTDDFGKVPGNIENCSVQNKKDGLRFVVHGLSPIMISWEAPDGVTPSPTPTPTATTPPDTKPTEDPNNKPSTTATAKPGTTTSPKPGATATKKPGSNGAGYQTGDNTHMGIWLMALVFCGVMALILYKKKRQ